TRRPAPSPRHDALPIWAEARRPEAHARLGRPRRAALRRPSREAVLPRARRLHHERAARRGSPRGPECDRDRDEVDEPAEERLLRSEEHTAELQQPPHTL